MSLVWSPPTSPILDELVLPRRSDRLCGAPHKLVKNFHVYLSEIEPTTNTIQMTEGLTDDISFSEAIKDPRWCAALKIELDSHYKNKTWDLVLFLQEENHSPPNGFSSSNRTSTRRWFIWRLNSLQKVMNKEKVLISMKPSLLLLSGPQFVSSLHLLQP